MIRIEQIYPFPELELEAALKTYTAVERIIWAQEEPINQGVWEYLKEHPEFEIDKSIQNKLLITVAPDGYLKRVS